MRAPAGCPEAKPVLERTIVEGSSGWAFGRGPVYVTFMDTPTYRGKGTSVAIYRGKERYGGYRLALEAHGDDTSSPSRRGSNPPSGV